MNFNLIYIQKQTLQDIEELIPWERDLYVEQLRQYIEEENLRLQQARADQRYAR